MTSPDLVARRASADQDERRIRALDEYDVLHGPQRRELTALVTLAAQVSGVPMATLNLISATHQHQVATVGFEGAVSDRQDSMCDVVLLDAEPVVLADASLDDRFRDNPWVTGAAHVRFYATHQLITPQDVAIGTLCVFDSEPRVIDEQQVSALADLADRVVDVLELELRSRQLARTIQRLERSEEELERSNAELAGYAGQVSHDLRAPLAAMLSVHEILADELAHERGSDPERAAWLLGRANRSARRMADMVAGMLAYASAGAHLAAVPVDLDRVLEQVRADLEAELADAVLTSTPLPTVMGDELQLGLVLQNLVENAVKFRRPGEPARIEVTATGSDGAWCVSVVDHGVGPGSAGDTLFEPFHRGGGTPGVRGSGLGLATCRKIVEAHGGRIGLEPTPGGGATAWFELPAGRA